MKAYEAINAADGLCANPFSSAQKLRWLNQIEYKVRIDVLQEDPADVEPIAAAALNTTELTLEDRYTEIYVAGLKTRYYWEMGEYDIYQNEKAMYEYEWNRWVRDVCDALHAGSGTAEYVYPAVVEEDGDPEEEDPEDENEGEGT